MDLIDAWYKLGRSVEDIEREPECQCSRVPRRSRSYIIELLVIFFGSREPFSES